MFDQVIIFRQLQNAFHREKLSLKSPQFVSTASKCDNYSGDVINAIRALVSRSETVRVFQLAIALQTAIRDFRN